MPLLHPHAQEERRRRAVWRNRRLDLAIGRAAEADGQIFGRKLGLVQFRRAFDSQHLRKPRPFANLRATDADGKVKRPIRRA